MCVPLGHRSHGGSGRASASRSKTVLSPDHFIRSRYWKVVIGQWGKVDAALVKDKSVKYWAKLQDEEMLTATLLKDLRALVEKNYRFG